MSSVAESLVFDVLSVLAGQFTQHQRILRLATADGAQSLLAESLRGEEGISRGFRFEVAALSLDASIPLKSLVGQAVLVELLTAAGNDALRPFHGHITAAEIVGANGGFARYKLVIEPWSAFLNLNRDSRIFQDMTVFDIFDTVFEGFAGKGRLAPAWRYDVRDPSIYAQRSLTTQYQESDLAFVERLMSEEGLFYFFEHEGDAASATLGTHTLVIADHNAAFVPNAQANVRFTQAGAVMREDSIDRWRTELRLQANAIELASWDYRSRNLRHVAADAGDSVMLVSRDHPGAYAYPSREQGERIAERQLQALEACRQVFIGAGTVRTFAAGTTFTLHGHSQYDGGDKASFMITRVSHLAHNNLNADTDDALAQLLGKCALKQAILADLASSLHAVGHDKGERPVYRNRIDAIVSSVPFRSNWADARGQLLHPRPIVRGQQTAIVVGPSGANIHTDRDHRIKVQFHWQRGQASHSRLQHPAPQGHTGAPADDTAGTWVRVATPLAPVAGANWGSHALPRVGQEVVVDFIEGNIDRPVVIGTLYNGAGQRDAQNNQVQQGTGASTGNAPAFFPGEAGAHAHPQVLSGIKSQAMADSQGGTGAYNLLVFDDTSGQSRTSLQHHASAHKGTAELNLGHLRHQSDNQRLAAAGFGAELKTEQSTALRAGKGLLLSTNGSTPAGTQLGSAPAQAQLESSHQLQVMLAKRAQAHAAKIKDDSGKDEADAAELPAIEQMAHAIEVVQSTTAGIGGDKDVQATVPAYSEPQLQIFGTAGIAATTPASAILVAGASSSITAGQDINFAAQGNCFHAVVAGISLFTYGKAENKDKPNQETGLRLHAASGKVSSQSLSGATNITADKAVTVASVTKSITIGAPKHVLLTAQGAFIKLSGGNIEVHGPGTMSFKASMKELAGPASTSSSVALPKGKLESCLQKLAKARADGAAVSAV